MGYEAGITQDALIIADAIHDYARSKRWKKNDYHIFMYGRTDIFTLRIIVIAKAAEGRTEEQEYDDYDDVVDLIELKAKPRLRALNFYGLVIKGNNDFGDYPLTDLGPDEFAIDEKLINHGASWTEPARPRASRGVRRGK